MKSQEEAPGPEQQSEADSSGLSWADQWDNHSDPPAASGDDKKKKEGAKSRFSKLWGLKWIKERGGKKPHQDS